MTKVKTHNFLTNICHRRIGNKDFISQSFIEDCYSFIFKYLNPIFMEIKFNENHTNILQLFWENCIPKEYLNFMYLEENFKKLHDLILKFNTCNNIVKKFIQDHKNNFELLKINLAFLKLLVTK